jgi:RNA polymerase sigma factor (sigma-70 family)
MAGQPLSPLLRFIRAISPAASAEHEEATDGQLLARFVRLRDQAAFAALFRRHGPMVWSVCRRVLPDSDSAEDAFQATFVVFFRKAGSIGRPELLANYLHGIAYRTAHKARSLGIRRRIREGQSLPDVPAPAEHPAAGELRPLLDEVLLDLPEKYRAPLVLCYLEGKTYAEAARLLGWAEGTVSGRLARARVALRGRLRRRGLVLSAATLAALLPQAAPAAMVPPGICAATLQAATGMISPSVAALAKGVLHAMLMSQCKMTAAVLLSVALIGTGAGITTQRYRVAAFSGPPILAAAHPEPTKATAVRPALADDKKDKEKDKKDKEKDESPSVKSPDGKIVAVATEKGISLFDQASGKEIRRMVGHRDKVTALAFSPDGSLLISGGADKATFAWDVVTGKTLWKFNGEARVDRVTFSKDGNTVSVQEGAKKRTLEAATGKVVHITQ